MSTYNSSSGTGRPQLILRSKSSFGWGWPRLVDIPKATTPPPNRASSVKSYSGAIYTAGSETSDTEIRNRASSLKSYISSILDTEGDSQTTRPISPVANRTMSVFPTLPEVTETEQLKSLRSPETLDCDSESCKTLPVTDGPVEPPSERSDDYQQAAESLFTGPRPRKSMSFADSLLAEVSPPQFFMEQEVPPSPKENSELPLSPPSPIILPVPQSTPLPEASTDSYFKAPSNPASPCHLATNSEFSLSLVSDEPDHSEKAPKSSHAFRELPRSPSSTDHQHATDITTSVRPAKAFEVPVLFDATKLPPPQILIIRATEDSVESAATPPVAPDLFDNADKAPKHVTTVSSSPPLSGRETQDLQNVNVGSPELSEVRSQGISRGTTALIREDLGTVYAVEIRTVPKAQQVKKRRKIVRKTRKAVLRSPVLKIMLGRHLALMIHPALKIIANGGDFAVTAPSGEGSEIHGAVETGNTSPCT